MPSITLGGKSVVTQTTPNQPIIANNVQFPAGHIIQTVSDFYDPPASGVNITNSTDDYLGSNLQVVLTPSSTSNKLIVFLFIPDCWNNNAVGRSIRIGYRYDTNGFSSGLPTTHLGTRGWVSGYHHYFGTAPSSSNLADITHAVVVDAPTTSEITIRPIFYGIGGTFTLCSNSTASASATEDHMDTMSLIVQEVQT